MNDRTEMSYFPITFLIVTLTITFPVIPTIILCQFKKPEKKKRTVLSVSNSFPMEKNDLYKKKTNNEATDSMENRKEMEQNETSQNNLSSRRKLKSTGLMQKTGKPLWVKRKYDIEYVADDNLKKGKNYQIIGDLDTTDSSYEYSLDNTLAIESFGMIKNKHGLILEGEEIDHQVGKATNQQNDSLDYSLFDSQTSKQDIREQQNRLLQLNTTIARRAAAALEDSIFSTSIRNNEKKPTAETDVQGIYEVEETQDKLMAHT